MSDLEQVVAGAGAADVVNENFRAVSPAAVYGRRPGSGGLSFSYYGGYLNGSSVADGAVTLAASEATIYVVAAFATGVVTSSTSNTNWNDTTNYLRIGIATTGASTITGFVDWRQAYTPGSGGGGMTNPMTTAGDIIKGGVAGAAGRLAIGSTGNVLTVVAGAPAWAAPATAGDVVGPASAVSGRVATFNGTTGKLIQDGGTLLSALATLAGPAFTGTATAVNMTFSGLLTTLASATGGAGLNLPHGAAPTSPVNGDLWTTTGGIYARINGATVGPLAAGGGGTPAGSTTQVQYNNAGAFGAEAAFAYDASTNILTVDKITLNGLLLTLATATGAAGFRLPHGTAPTSPTNGDMWTTTAGLYARINGATVGPLIATASSVTGFTASLNTASPNNTVNAARLLAATSSTDGDFVTEPKGVGAFMLNLPDGTATGGNKRGVQAVDLQLLRSAATNVASGGQSFLGGGIYNTASGASSGVVAGDTNTVSAANGFCGGGNANAVTTSNNAANLGGANNVASGTGAITLGGSINIADSAGSVAMGIRTQTNGMLGVVVRASGPSISFTQGGRQARDATLQADTSNTTATPLTTDGAAAGATNQFVILSDSALKIKGQVIVRNPSTKTVGWWDISGACKNSAGTTSLVGTPVVSAFAGDAALNTCTVSIAADATNNCLKVSVAGIAATNLNWACEATSIEMVA